MSTLRPTRVVALLNQKGGVGKTTTTVNLGAAIAEAGRRTLLVDLDPQGHLTLHLGIEPAAPDRPRPTMYELLVDPAATAESAIVNAGDHLDVIPSTVDLAAAETELAGDPARNGILARKLAPLLPQYEFILFDCPPSLGLLTINALCAAREVVVPMQAHFLALQGVGKLLETVGLVAGQVNRALKVTGIVLCMHEASVSHQREVVADLDEFFARARGTDAPWSACRVLRPPIRRNIKLAEAPSYGKTIFAYAPKCPGAEDYRALAQRVVAEWDAMLERRAARDGAGVA
ncbi:MAG TPA: AAA family ATPase [Phycisphaerales bacterium]|nr:AAA family ATPase [Phycisphaerales bacterium]HMP36161.1 AAA family ATPase [Phycisphaerales bacterium]